MTGARVDRNWREERRGLRTGGGPTMKKANANANTNTKQMQMQDAEGNIQHVKLTQLSVRPNH